jgi:hypothetical protein
MKEKVERFKEVLFAIAEKNTESDSGHGGYDEFFAEFFKDTMVLDGCIVFVMELLNRLSVSERECSATRIARYLQANMPSTRRYFNEKRLIKRDQREIWQREIRMMNWQYITAAKLVLYLLSRIGGNATINRAAFDAIDETKLRSKYLAELDAIEFSAVLDDVVTRLEDKMEDNPALADEWRSRFDKEKIDADKGHENWDKLRQSDAKPFQTAVVDAKEELAVVVPIEEKDPSRLDLID